MPLCQFSIERKKNYYAGNTWLGMVNKIHG